MMDVRQDNRECLYRFVPHARVTAISHSLYMKYGEATGMLSIVEAFKAKVSRNSKSATVMKKANDLLDNTIAAG